MLVTPISSNHVTPTGGQHKGENGLQLFISGSGFLQDIKSARIICAKTLKVLKTETTYFSHFKYNKNQVWPN